LEFCHLGLSPIKRIDPLNNKVYVCGAKVFRHKDEERITSCKKSEWFGSERGGQINSDAHDCCCCAGKMREGRHGFVARVGDGSLVDFHSYKGADLLHSPI
jgi:hypothetical protein